MDRYQQLPSSVPPGEISLEEMRDLSHTREGNAAPPLSSPPSFHSSQSNNENDQLMDAFGEDSESEGEDGTWDDRQIEQSQEPPRAGFFNSSEQAYQPLEGYSSSAATLTSDSSTAPPPSSPSGGSSVRTANRPQRGLLSYLPWANRGSGHLTTANQNDGVFANLSAKPETDKPSEDFPPTYEEAALDQTPPYWETTIMAPGFADEVFIEGLPVGSPINFIWNMMVSSAFQFVGFLLTYLLHTSHAAKHGSRAGLGFTLFQYGFYLQPNAAGEATAPSQEFEPSQPNNFDVDASSKELSGSFRDSPVSDSAMIGSNASSWISFALMILGAIMILKAINDYVRARKMELVIQGPSTAVPRDQDEAEV